MDDKQRASYAEQIIKNPLWEELFKEAKQDFFEKFCVHTDMESRERIAMAMDIMEDLNVILAGWVLNGVNVNEILDKSTGDSNGD